MKRILFFVLTLAILCTTAVPAFAAVPEDDALQPQFTYIDVTRVGLSINTSTGIATSTASCYAGGGYTVEVVCKLQRYTGSSWTTVKTWTSTGTSAASVNEIWAVYSGYTYRNFSTFIVRNSAGQILESTSNYKTYVYPAKN